MTKSQTYHPLESLSARRRLCPDPMTLEPGGRGENSMLRAAARRRRDLPSYKAMAYRMRLHVWQGLHYRVNQRYVPPHRRI